MNIRSRLPEVGTTIFTIMSQLALDHKSINLGQGFPDFHPDPQLIELVAQAMRDGHNQYPAMPGYLPLRQAISRKIEKLYGYHYDPQTEITVTSGATEALMSSLLALVHPGDEVIVIDPSYDLYRPAIRLAGGIAVSVPMTPPSPEQPVHSINWDRVRKAITPKTRLIVLNSPHNPTGMVMQEQDLDALQDIVEGTDILLLSDEVYEHILFDSRPHASLSTRHALAGRSVVISSFGKTYHTTGWKVGYLSAPAALTAEVRKVHQFTVFTTTSPLQVALAEYLRQEDKYLSLSSFYQARRDHLQDGLRATRFRPLPSHGTFFLLADYREISALPEADFARWLTVEHGVTAIPVSAFYGQPDADHANNGLVRLCFAKQDETLNAALEKLRRV